MTKRVVLAMSGGVDSSVAALLLREQGYEVIGLFMRSGASEEVVCQTPQLPIVKRAAHKQGCCSASDAADARRVADRLDIPFHALNFQESFGLIKDYFVREYLSGRTPNPCVQCNNWLKFGKMWDFARQVGAEAIATGHYAQLKSLPGETFPGLFKGLDQGKDQSYVLSGLKRELLQHILFPVGGFTKAEIRERAREVGLRVADKPDSQEICFVPDHDYAAFIRRHERRELDTSGQLVDTSGTVLGEHAGFEQFTIGQRKGLGIAFGEPRYVIRVEADTKRVVVGTRDELERPELEADQINWLADDLPATFPCTVKIRSQHKGVPAEVDRLDADRIRVRFQHPECGIAPGQAVVFYDDNRVLGSGWIL
ncbi:MAG: tRNA 2-thiouridine(34) synthase MnmA [Planctomycetaceae bacterium]|nr:tRNA 2-thiouridine(34) synthase MnmA [Planctomycetaceae bacterium]